jgi:hypothetical protein
MSDIKVNIIGEFQKKGFDDADKAVKNLTRSFQKLGAALGVALSARAFFNFSKQGALAFAAEEKAVRQLTNALGNLGFAYAAPGIERYLEATEQATMVTKEELRPAIVNLISTTMDAEKAMSLLATAIDASVETGTDLTNITSAITRAYAGNYSAISKLTRGYSSAQLKALGFEKTIELLSDRFAGAAAASTDTYSFKIAQLQKAVGDAQKAIGEGLIKAVEQLGSGDYDQGLQDLVDFGKDIGDAFGYAAGAVDSLKQAYDIITLRGVRDLAMDLMGKTPAQRGGTLTPTQFELAKANVERRKELTLQKRIIAERKKAAALTEKEKKNQLALNKAKSILDLEKIQIEAALKGKITEEERTRLLLMKAIVEENGTEATELAKKLKELQADTEKLAKTLTEFPTANDPFADWTKTLTAVQAQLLAIAQKKIVVDFLANFSMTMPTFPSSPSSAAAAVGAATSAAAAAASNAAEGAANELAGDAAAAAAEAAAAAAAAAEAQAAAAAAAAAAKTEEEKAAAQAAILAAEAAAAAAAVQTEAAAALEYAAANAMAEVARLEAETATRVAELLAAEAAAAAAAAAIMDSEMLFGSSVIGAAAAGVPITEITVNVAGSVTTQDDLVEVITDQLYQYQKSGKGLLYSSVAI